MCVKLAAVVPTAPPERRERDWNLAGTQIVSERLARNSAAGWANPKGTEGPGPPMAARRIAVLLGPQQSGILRHDGQIFLTTLQLICWRAEAEHDILTHSA